MPALKPVPPGRAYLLWIGLLGLVMLYFAMLMITALPVERRLGQQIEKAIDDSGLTRVNPALRGRDVVLHGSVSSPEMIARARQLVETVDGVRKVDAMLAVEVWKLPWLRLQSDEEGGRVMTGRLPLAGQRDQVAEALSNAGVVAENRIRVDPEVAMPDWIELVQPLFESGEELERFSMEIGAGKLTVGGRLYSAGSVQSRLQVLGDLADPFDLQIINRIAMVSRVD